jgi:predicted DNA-binding transcriptional regulator
LFYDSRLKSGFGMAVVSLLKNAFMKRLLIAAGLAGLAYYLKRNPKVVSDLKDKATDALSKIKGSSNGHTSDINAVH